VDAIVTAMSSVPGVYVWIAKWTRPSPVRDHAAGDPDAVAEAAILGTGKAMELIDLTNIRGRTRA